MPHQCTTCGRTFPDGSKEMLSGCPDCGGNKFQFKPAGATTDEPSTPSEQPTSDPTERSSPAPDDRSPRSGDPASTGDPDSADPADAVDANEPTSTNPSPTPDTDPSSTPDTDPSPTPDTDPSSTPDTDPSAADADSTPSDAEQPEPADSTTGSERVRERDAEDVAQASARSDVVSPDELDQASRPVDSDADARDPADPDAPRPDIGELRDELNEQFESIRIVSPGKYELNLMELYDRQEYIISLQEDGRYVIEMPDAWGIQDE